MLISAAGSDCSVWKWSAKKDESAGDSATHEPIQILDKPSKVQNPVTGLEVSVAVEGKKMLVACVSEKEASIY